MRNKDLKILVLILFLLVSSCLFYTSNVEANVLNMIEIFFTEDSLQEEYFTDQILAQLSVADLENIRNDVIQNVGSYKNVEIVDAHLFNVIFESGIVEIQMVVNEEGKIAGLFLMSITETKSGLQEIIQEFIELPGKVSLLITKNGNEIASINPDQKMAVGSTFKLVVLKTLQNEIESGKLNWFDVVELKEEQISLPSGQLQDWPVNSPVTLHTLASLMISVSDNTATDMLIDHIGRKNIEDVVSGNEPFLKTREAFVLKAPENEDLLEKYRNAELNDKYDLLLETNERPLPSVAIFDRVRGLDIEWYFNSFELKNLMESVKDIELMGINPGLASPRNWDKVAYKGGSEPGAFNLTTWLEKDENQIFFTATWNHDQPLDENNFMQLYLNILGVLQNN